MSTTLDTYKPPIDQDFNLERRALVAMAEFICAFTRFGSLPMPIYLKSPICSQGKLLSTIALIRVVLTITHLNEDVKGCFRPLKVL